LRVGLTGFAGLSRFPIFTESFKVCPLPRQHNNAMLKHRQDGLVFLHGLFLDVAIVVLFLIQIGTVRMTGWIQFNVGVNWSIYLMGVIFAMIWNHHALKGVASRLGTLTFMEACHLTRQQMFRLLAVLCAVGFATRDVEVSREFVAWFVMLSGGVLLIGNWLMPRRLASFLFRSVKFRTVVLASEPDARRLQAWLSSRAYLGQLVVGCITPPGKAAGNVGAEVAALGSVDQLRQILADQQINQVVINRREFTEEETRLVLEEAEHAGCRVRYFLDLRSTFGEEMSAVECNHQFAFAAHAAEPLDNPINCLVKRTLDLAVAIPMVCLVLPPLTVLVAIAHRLQSRGPVFHRQERSGLNRQKFHIFKYRTMHVGGENQRGTQATRDDHRVFAFGRFLRKTSLDEFPQFINVLLGEMSVSGPRPHLLEHDEKFAEMVGSYYMRHFVKPGITGLAQSEGYRGEVVGRPELLQKRIDRDLRYVNMWSLQLDLRIIAATARQVVKPPRAAY
jgi:exopolysaccharide biosynthesis polyprenyl glycosylphosphotransferase